MLSDLQLSKQLALRLIIKNFSAQYRQTYLGYFWAIIPAVFTTLVFVYLNNKKILNVDIPDTPYVVYVLAGMILWQLFTDALQAPLKHTAQAMAMFRKINFPREAVILAGLGEVLINFLIRLILLIVVMFFYDNLPGSYYLLIPLGVVALIILGTFFGLLILPLGLLYQDISKLLVIGMTFWFVLTPVIYPVTDENSITLLLNPVAPLLVTTRNLLIDTGNVYVTQSLVITSIALFLSILAWIVYRIATPHLIERMGA